MVKFPILGNGWSHAYYAKSKACQYMHVKCRIYGHSSRHELHVNSAMSLENSNQHGFDFWFWHPSLFRARVPVCEPFSTWPFCFRIVLEHRRFVIACKVSTRDSFCSPLGSNNTLFRNINKNSYVIKIHILSPRIQAGDRNKVRLSNGKPLYQAEGSDLPPLLRWDYSEPVLILNERTTNLHFKL